METVAKVDVWTSPCIVLLHGAWHGVMITDNYPDLWRCIACNGGACRDGACMRCTKPGVTSRRATELHRLTTTLLMHPLCKCIPQETVHPFTFCAGWPSLPTASPSCSPWGRVASRGLTRTSRARRPSSPRSQVGIVLVCCPSLK